MPNISLIRTAPNRVVNNIADETIAVYTFLQERLNQCRVDEDHVFKFMYRSFYRLDNAGLGAKIKTRYFELMREVVDGRSLDLKYLVEELFKVPTEKGQNSVQFSFITKLANTIDVNNPIYDSEVATVFGFKYPTDKGMRKYDKYIHYYDELKKWVDSVERNPSEVSAALDIFDARFSTHRVPMRKSLDFILWSAGKLMKKEQ